MRSKEVRDSVCSLEFISVLKMYKDCQEFNLSYFGFKKKKNYYVKLKCFLISGKELFSGTSEKYAGLLYRLYV